MALDNLLPEEQIQPTDGSDCSLQADAKEELFEKSSKLADADFQ